MKKVFAIILTVSLALSFAGCKSSKTEKESLPTAKNATLTHFIDALKEADKSKADKYGDYDQVVRQLEINGIDMNDQKKADLVKATFSKLDVEIHSVDSQDKNTKVVHATVVTKDMVTALDTAVRNMYKNADQHYTQSQTGKLQKDNYDIFLEAINDKNLTTVSHDATFTISKESGKWKVKMDNVSLDFIYGGYVNQKVDTIENAYKEYTQANTPSNMIDESGEAAAN